MLKSLASLWLLFLGSMFGLAQTRIISHVTAPDGGFTTNLVIENTAVSSQDLTLHPFDADGNALTQVDMTLGAQSVMRQDSQTLFGGAASHFTIEGSTQVKVNVSYDFASGASSPALLSESDTQGSIWRLFPGNWDQIFDGIAVVNTGSEPTDVWLTQKDDQNQNVLAVKIATGLAPNAKLLYVIGSANGSEFSNDAAYFEVSADQRLAVTALQGTLINPQINILWAAEARPISQASFKRDERGVWFIEDGSLYDVMEMMGYAVAQDRLFQMDVFRRQARGTLGEIVSVNQISNIGEIDALARQSAYSDAELDAYYANLDAESRIMIQAYVNGLNRRIAQVNAQSSVLLPLEFQLLGESQVHPWTHRDVMQHIANFQRGFSMRNIGAEQVMNGALLQDLTIRYGAEQAAMMFNDLRYVADPESQTMIGYASGKRAISKAEQPLAYVRSDLPDIRRGAFDFVNRVARIKQTLKDNGILIKGGSYAWAVSGDRTVSGNPVLYSGPQVGFGAPGLFVEGSIVSDAVTVSGMAIPGIPGIIVGRTPHHAWSMQVGYAGTWDYYLEDEADISVVRQETIKVKDGQDFVIDIEASEHGVILQDLGEMRLAFKYAHRDYNFELSEGLLNLARASNMDEFGEAVSHLAVSQHLCYVDQDGNIAYWHSGRQPVRPAGDWRVPQGMLEGQDVLEWDAAVVEPLITERNPSKGYFGGWNNKPDADFIDYSATAGFGPYHRGHAIFDYFESFDDQAKFSYEDLRDLAMDIATTGQWAAGGNPWTQLGEAVIDTVNANPTTERMAVLDMFNAWDGHSVAGGPSQWALSPDLADASVFLDAMVPRLLSKTFSDETGNPTDTLSNITRFQVFLHGLYERGLNNSYDWYSNLDDAEAPQTSDGIILETIDELLAELGDRPWGTNARGTIDYFHVLFGNITALGIVTPTPGAQRSTYAQCIEYGSSGPTRIESFFQLGQSGTITGSAIAPIFDPNSLNMKDDFDNWIMRNFPLFTP